MTANAYVLLRVVPDKTQEVKERLSQIPGALVREVFGPHDLVVELEADTTVDITSTVSFKIRSIPHVTQTITCMWVAGAFSGDAGGD